MNIKIKTSQMKCSTNNRTDIFYRTDGLGHGPTIRSIFLADPTFPRRLDVESVRFLLQSRLPPGRTFFTGITKHEAAPPAGSLTNLRQTLLQSAEREERLGLVILYHPVPSPIQTLLQKEELQNIPVYSPANGKIDTSDPQLLAALPDTVAAMEEPFDSMLPVMATLAARAMKRDGIDHAVVIHPASISPSNAAAIFHSMGLSSQSICPTADQNIQAQIDLSLYLETNIIPELAATLNLPLDLSSPRRPIIWTTLSLLHTQMTGHLLKERKKIQKR